MLALRRAFGRVPSAPHCKMCHAPFGGIGGLIVRPWFGQWERNSQLCKNCMRSLIKRGVGGAEVELSLLFADIRGSTALGERLRPAEFSSILSAFYRLAAAAIVANDGVVDKFVGDEAIGLFIPGFSAAQHAAKAIAAGRAIMRAAGRTDASPSGAIPVGAGVHTGIAYVGSLGSSEQISDFTPSAIPSTQPRASPRSPRPENSSCPSQRASARVSTRPTSSAGLLMYAAAKRGSRSTWCGQARRPAPERTPDDWIVTTG